MMTADDTPTPLQWHDGLLLGYQPMDATHEEFVLRVAALQQATDAELPARLEPFAEHAVRHFGEEDRWMEQTQFPARECHIDEHAAVLKSVREVQALLAQGHTGPCRRLAQELAQWFPGHADYLDSALAHWMCKWGIHLAPLV